MHAEKASYGRASMWKKKEWLDFGDAAIAVALTGSILALVAFMCGRSVDAGVFILTVFGAGYVVGSSWWRRRYYRAAAQLYKDET